MATPVLAADSLRITTPLAGSIVAGDLYIEGSIAGHGDIDLTLTLAPQSFGECGLAVAQITIEVSAAEGFAAIVDTTAVADGVYCIVAVADRGRLSDVQADITVSNALSGDDGLQLPTLPLPEPTDGVSAVDAAVPVGSGTLLAAVAFGLAGLLALGVAVFGILVSRTPDRP